jgi:hypothetical protein
LLTPGDYLPKVDLWDKLEHGLSFGVVAFTGAVAFLSRSSLLRLASDCHAWVPYSKSSRSLFPGGKLLSATP